MTGWGDHEAAAGGGPLKPVVIETEAFEPALRFETWRAAFLGVNDTVVAPERRAAFAARNVNWRLGPMLVTHNRTPALRLTRAAKASARDGLDHWVVRLMMSGGSCSVSGDRIVAAQAGQIVLERLSDGYVDELGDAEWMTVSLPPERFPELSEGLSRRPRGVVGGPAAGMLGDFLAALARRLPQAQASDEAALAEAVRAVVMATLPPPPGAARDGGAIRARAEAAIWRNIGSARLDVARIAALSGVSRSTICRQFEAEGGVARYVQRHRLAKARADLADPALAGAAISTIAERCGFHCASSFSRAFRRAFGCTPGEARALPASAAPAEPPDEPPGSFAWLLRR